MAIDLQEALRYLGVRSDPDGRLLQRMSQLYQDAADAIAPRWLWRRFRLIREGNAVRAEGTELLFSGRSAQRMLADCGECILLCCTLGAAFDQRVRQLQARSMSDAVMLDAIGSAWVEAACDEAEAEMRSRFPGQYLTDRFSPGYGDVPLTLQTELLRVLDAPRRLGVTALDSLLMAPQKSVTAIIGLADRPQQARIRGCAFCALQGSCALRRTGQRCAP